MMSETPRIVPLRLQKFLARAGIASRRGSEDLMTAGRVQVNGKTVTELGTKVDPLVDTITVDGVRVDPNGSAIALMLNKPAGYITTMTDPHGRPCVADLVPTNQYPGLYPIGRLDKDTTGLLLFSTNGELGNKLLHPRYHVSKTYRVGIRGVLDAPEVTQLEQGVKLDDGLTAPAKIVFEQPQSKKSSIYITIHEGRKRQVRRMFEAVGHPVTSLERVQFGPLALDGLKQGSWRLLDTDEYAKLCELVGIEVE